ncbi:hypothetical protein [Pedobacter sp. Leaf41]|uniref:hypothetical protein n=1 Tax=Pedobacter sp. Leaf41 TaxID=1736218 RepID=UPI000A786245|nr:hypothetical protein [Pedobacter sp. Leaf41]
MVRKIVFVLFALSAISLAFTLKRKKPAAPGFAVTNYLLRKAAQVVHLLMR